MSRLDGTQQHLNFTRALSPLLIRFRLLYHPFFLFFFSLSQAKAPFRLSLSVPNVSMVNLIISLYHDLHLSSDSLHLFASFSLHLLTYVCDLFFVPLQRRPAQGVPHVGPRSDQGQPRAHLCGQNGDRSLWGEQNDLIALWSLCVCIYIYIYMSENKSLFLMFSILTSLSSTLAAHSP